MAGMFAVEVYAAVRDFVFNQQKSRREAARVFGLSRETIGTHPVMAAVDVQAAAVAGV